MYREWNDLSIMKVKFIDFDLKDSSENLNWSSTHYPLPKYMHQVEPFLGTSQTNLHLSWLTGEGRLEELCDTTVTFLHMLNEAPSHQGQAVPQQQFLNTFVPSE